MTGESGRSMVEMLGVLAIFGVLSVVGISALQSALDSHDANEIVAAVNRRATLLAADKTLGTGLTPSEAFGQDTSYTITCTDINTDLFSCTVQGVPQNICQKVLALEWKLPIAIVPTACTETNEMVFTFNKDLDGSGTLCDEENLCPDPNAACTNGVCVDPEQKSCDLATAENPSNPCGDECQICNNETLKCENACERKKYLQSDGGQWIDTSYYPNQDTKIECKLYNPTDFDTSKPGSILFGARDGTSNNQYTYTVIGNMQNRYGMRWDYGFVSENVPVYDYPLTVGEHIIVKDKQYCYLDGTLVATNTTDTFSINYPMHIFGTNTTGTNTLPFAGKYYYFKIWDNGTLVRDFIPVVYTPNNEACMYDKVEKKLYHNTGDGNFSTN